MAKMRKQIASTSLSLLNPISFKCAIQHVRVPQQLLLTTYEDVRIKFEMGVAPLLRFSGCANFAIHECDCKIGAVRKSIANLFFVNLKRRIAYVKSPLS